MTRQPSELLQILDAYEEYYADNYSTMRGSKALWCIEKLRRIAFGHLGYGGECQLPLPPDDSLVATCLSDIPNLSAHERAALAAIIARRWDWWCKTVGGEEMAIGINSAFQELSARDRSAMDGPGEPPATLHSVVGRAYEAMNINRHRQRL